MKILLTVLLLFLCNVLYAGTKDEITTMLHQQNEAWNKGDLEAFLKPYDSSDRLVFMGSSGPVRSLKVLKEHYESRYKKGEKDFGKLTFSGVEVEELSPDLARAWGKWIVEQQDNKVLSGWFSLILQKKTDGWKIIHDHSS
jgi:ketosteroid isomerase-like protein